MYFFPRRYEDRSQLTKIAQVTLGQWQTVMGKIIAKSSRKSWHTRKHVSEVTIDDGSGRLCCVWFSQPYLENYFRVGKQVICYGKTDVYKNRLQMIAPEYELIEGEEDQNLSTNRIVPIYPLTKGVTQRFLRKTVRACLDKYRRDVQDELPAALRNKYRLFNIKRSLEFIHFPDDFGSQEEAIKRISFEEFFFFQISIILRRLSITQKQGMSHSIDDVQALEFINAFSFDLTNAQKRAIQDIRLDMQKDSPMLRLLQGDVGCGKTLVAIFGCWVAALNGRQSAIMAPTEILAQQHYENIKEMIRNGVLKDLKVALLVSHLKKKEKESLCRQIQEGSIDLVVGTHALISEEITYKNLSFVVIDEQHKFGVRQRALLAEKGINPDVLIMTATPIPRTLYISLYGDMDVSVIDEMPPGRGNIKTVLYTPEQSEDVYKIVREKAKEGRQAYFVYPIIEESAKTDLKAAEEMFRHFTKKEFKDFQVELVHGQMPRKESQSIMGRFKNKEIDMLVATTVIEVGVDVPNASIMVIEHAQRFGLAQLHQLRGRIGRGPEDSLCLLIAEPVTDESVQRLQAILATTDGFEIAEKDLMIRGPGRYFGRHQHGLNELKVANPLTQLDTLELARKEALALTDGDPYLTGEENQRIKSVIKKRYPTYLQMVTAG